MASLQAANAASAAASPRASGGNAAMAATPQVKPFCQAAKIGTRLVGSFAPVVSASPAPIGPIALASSGGYVKRWVLEDILTGGGGTTAGVLSADAPWDLNSLVTLTEPNNNPVVNLTGYNLQLADIYGGYAYGVGPGSDPDYSANGSNPAIWPYIPIELDPTGLGALSDLSSSSGYQLYLLPNPDTTVWTTLPVPLPTRAINVYAEYWTLPDTSDSSGAQQAIVPPRAGTIQMWNQILNIALAAGGGNQEYQLNRMGNRLRTILMVMRSSSARAAGVFPSPMRLEWDDVILRNQSPQYIRKQLWEMTGADTQPPTGVFGLMFSNGISRLVGGNGASSWLPTVVDTRWAMSGNFAAATAPTLDWIVNDVSYAPLGAVERTTVGASGPGYHPGSTVGQAG